MSHDRRSRALSSRTIVGWSVGVAVAAAAAVTLLWVLLGSGSPADARRLDTIRTASSLVIGAGGAAALLLAARRQRYVELDLEQKEHDADERRVTELYSKAADQLGSDKAPVRLAGVYALERLAQDHPVHRQTIVNLLCAYLRMPYEPPRGPDDHERLQERLVRGAVQEVFETHLRPSVADRFWPDMDLTLTGAALEYFWFRDCQARDASFRHVTFHEIAAFRGSTFTGRTDFQDTHFTGTADLRRTTFGPGTTSFRRTRFEGDVTFGDGRVDLTGAAATPTAARTWPTTWRDEPDPGDPDLLRVVPTP
jgi:pentapeptide repeat protein